MNSYGKPHIWLNGNGLWICRRVTFGGVIVRGHGNNPLEAWNDMHANFDLFMKGLRK